MAPDLSEMFRLLRQIDRHPADMMSRRKLANLLERTDEWLNDMKFRCALADLLERRMCVDEVRRNPGKPLPPPRRKRRR